MKKLCFLLALALVSCDKDTAFDDQDVLYKDLMRQLVIGISQKAKTAHPGFAIVPQNGIQLVTRDGEANGGVSVDYLNAVDGHGQEDLFFGYDYDDVPTPWAETKSLVGFLDLSKSLGKKILVTDYCATPAHIDASKNINAAKQYVSFAGVARNLDVVPNTPVTHENASVVTRLDQVQNFLYLIDYDKFATAQDFINAVTATNYDLLIMDHYFKNTAFTSAQIQQLRHKANGGQRIVIAYMSIGEAENYRYYWNSAWNTGKPNWMAAENPDWPGNFKVRYWSPEWQDLIYKANDSYLNKILDVQYDGVYLDVIDAFEFFEE